MTLDEAIKHAIDVAEAQEEKCKHAGHDHYTKLEASACAANHRQLVEWLTELKELREKDAQSSCSEKPNRSDTISRQAAIDVLDVLCQEHRYKIPGKIETYSQYNEAWQDALDRAEGAIFNLPSVQPEIIRCKDCKHRDAENGFCEGRGFPMQLVPDDGFATKGKGAKNDLQSICMP